MHFLKLALANDVKRFLKTINMTRQQVLNFAKVACLLSKLIEKVNQYQSNTKKFLFKILKIKYAIIATIYGICPALKSHFYINSLGYRTGLVII